MTSIIPNLRNRIISEPTGVKAEIGTQIGTQPIHDVPILSSPKANEKTTQLQESAETPLSTPIAYNFIFNRGTDFNNVLPLALPDIASGEAQCDKCKLKDAEGGVVGGVG